MTDTKGLRPTTFKARGNDWWTPRSLIEHLHDEYAFDTDAAADDESALFEQWFGPGSAIAEDGLEADWSGRRIFCNPPFRLARQFIEKASRAEADEAVLLVPASIDTRWWDRLVLPTATSIRFIRGRMAFERTDGAPNTTAIPNPMCLINWRRSHPSGHVQVAWSWTWPFRPDRGWVAE